MSVTDDGFLLDWVQRARARGGDQAPSGWPLNPPSSAEMLEATEARLGVRLPPLYRSLLSLSNGIMDVPNDVSVPSLLPCDRIAWMRDVDPILLDTVDTESAEHDHEPIRPEPWDLGDDRPCTACLPDTLVIGQHPTGGYILLDPHQVAPSGEWACWDYDVACVITGRFPDLRTYFHFSCNDFLPPPAGHDPVAAARRVMQDPAEDLWGRQQAAYALEALGRADLVLPWLLDQLAECADVRDHRASELLARIATKVELGARSPRLVELVSPWAIVSGPGMPSEGFQFAVLALAHCGDSHAETLVHEALRHDCAHDWALQESMPCEQRFVPDFWALWERTGDPGWLVRANYAGDESTVPVLAAWVSGPKPDPSVFVQDAEMIRGRVAHILEAAACGRDDLDDLVEWSVTTRLSRTDVRSRPSRRQ